MPAILVLGSGGMLGNTVCEYFARKNYTVRGLDRGDFDAANPDFGFLKNEIKNSGLVMNCIGIIRHVIEKFSAEEVLKINSVFPRNLAMICQNMNVPLIHITTDCVYSGSKGKYTENDFFDADDLYGISKLAGEPKECMTLRTSIIGPEKQTAVSLMSWAFSMKGKNVKGYTNHHWNGVTTLYFTEIAEQIFRENLYKTGLFHMHSPDPVSKYELLALFNDVFGLDLNISPVEAPVFCDRTLGSIYPLSASLSVKTIKKQLVELKEFFSL